MHGDCSATFLVGDVDDVGRRLVQVTYESLWKGIDAVRPGGRINEIGRAIQTHAEAERVQRRARRSSATASARRSTPRRRCRTSTTRTPTRVIEPGMTFTIEPMINEGSWELGRIWPDGWTAPTRDGSRSAQFEHSLLVTADRRRGAHAPPRRDPLSTRYATAIRGTR